MAKINEALAEKIISLIISLLSTLAAWFEGDK